MKILLIDDSRTLRTVTKSFLAALDHPEILEASDGQSALTLLAATSTPPDLILVDLSMPHMDGLTFTLTLRKTHPHLPVLLLATPAETPLITDAIKAGIDNFILKPFTPQMLLLKIQQTLALPPKHP